MELTLSTLQSAHTDAVMELFCTCFAEDHYYADLFPEETTRAEEMRRRFTPSVRTCLESGLCRGVWQGESLAAFTLVFDYGALKQSDPTRFAEVFGGQYAEGRLELPYRRDLHGRVEQLDGQVLFLLSVAVRPDLQRRGLAGGLIDLYLNEHPDCTLVSDVSNDGSLELYRRRNFNVEPIEEGYHLVLHRAGTATACPGETLRLLVPAAGGPELPGGESARTRLVPGLRVGQGWDTAWFERDENAVAEALLVEPEGEAFWRYQRWMSMAHYGEHAAGDCLYYVQEVPYRHALLYNDLLREMTAARRTEWSVIPDVYVSVPVQYTAETLAVCEHGRETGSTMRELLRALEFRTYYESGIPSQKGNVDDLASFKRRIRRYSLGRVEVQLTDEITLEQYRQTGDPIGQPGLVELYLSVDTESGCAVLTLFALAAPFLLSHFMDNVARNQLLVARGEERENLYDWLNREFHIIKRGTAKILVTVPRPKSCLADSQIASLLASETIYPDGENFGRIIDQDILAAVESETGMGQYDRAFLCAYTTTVLQFCPDLSAAVKDRIFEESVALFYIELILMEEAAIHIADQSIVKLFSEEVTSPVEFLSKVDAIYDDYSSTIDFWNIQVNYPTSQKSIQMLRDAFQLDQQLGWMQRNLDHMKLVFETKCDLIDRKESRRMDVSLGILSFFAVFSAWIDGHDYISTWSDVLPENVIHLLQRGLFAGVLAVAGYAFLRLVVRRREKKPRNGGK